MGSTPPHPPPVVSPSSHNLPPTPPSFHRGRPVLRQSLPSAPVFQRSHDCSENSHPSFSSSGGVRSRPESGGPLFLRTIVPDLSYTFSSRGRGVGVLGKETCMSSTSVSCSQRLRTRGFPTEVGVLPHLVLCPRGQGHVGGTTALQCVVLSSRYTV